MLVFPFQNAVTHHPHFVHLGGNLQIVGDDNDTAAFLVGQAQQNLYHLLAIGNIQIASGSSARMI